MLQGLMRRVTAVLKAARGGEQPGRPRARVEDLSPAGQWRLVELAYAHPEFLWTSLVGFVVPAVLTAHRAAVIWPLWWTLSGFVITTIRLRESYAFKRGRRQPTLARARRRFTTLAWMMGAQWGCADLALFMSHDQVIRFWFINTQAVVLVVAVTLTSPVLSAARGSVLLVLVPLLLTCLCDPSPELRVYAMLIAAYLVSCLKVIDILHQRTLTLLMGEERNAALLHSVRDANDQLEAANIRLRAMASTDGLTGIPNRRAFDGVLEREWARCVREQRAMSLLMIDIDQFKAFNDHCGHQAGDDCLRQVAHCLAAAIGRQGDYTARLGGEEFAVILPETDLAGALVTAERLREAVQALGIPAPASRCGCVTVSIGAAMMQNAKDQAGPEEMIAAADAQLYRAKSDGRNRVRAAQPATPALEPG